MLKVDENRGSSNVYFLLLLPFIGLLFVPFFNRAEPALFGFPFFYWYQFAWVPVSSLLTWIVWRSTRTRDDEREDARPAGTPARGLH